MPVLRRRKGAADDPDLEKKCEAIDEAIATERELRLAKEVDLELPKGKTVVEEQRPPALEVGHILGR